MSLGLAKEWWSLTLFVLRKLSYSTACAIAETAQWIIKLFCITILKKCILHIGSHFQNFSTTGCNTALSCFWVKRAKRNHYTGLNDNFSSFSRNGSPNIMCSIQRSNFWRSWNMAVVVKSMIHQCKLITQTFLASKKRGTVGAQVLYKWTRLHFVCISSGQSRSSISNFSPAVMLLLALDNCTVKIKWKSFSTDSILCKALFCSLLSLYTQTHIHTADVEAYFLRHLAVDLETEQESSLFMRCPWHFPAPRSVRESKRILLNRRSTSHHYIQPLPHPGGDNELSLNLKPPPLLSE